MKQVTDTIYGGKSTATSLQKKAAIYTRLSLDNEESTATKRQEKECRDYAKQHGLEVVDVYCDEGISGFSGKRRPAFERAIADMEAGKYSVLIVWKLDRLSRQGCGVVFSLIDRFEKSERRIMSVMDKIDSSDLSGRMMIAIVAEMARSESVNNSIRAKAQRRESRRIGRQSNCPAWCYVRDENGQLIPKPEAHEDARTAVDMALNGDSPQKIADFLNSKGHTTKFGKRFTRFAVRRWLVTPSLCGLVGVKVGEEMALYIDPDTNEPVSIGQGIATEAEWRTLCAHRERRRAESKPQRKSRNVHPLVGLMKCGICGENMHRWGIDQFRCSGQSTKTCSNGMSIVPLWEHIETQVLNRLTTRDLDDPILNYVSQAWRGTEQTTDAKAQKAIELLDTYKSRLDSLLSDKYERGLFDGNEDLFTEHFEAMNTKIKAQQKIVDSIDPMIGVGHVVDFSEPEVVREAWDAISDVERGAIMRELLDRIIMGPKTSKKPLDFARLTFEWRG